jgi:ureidoacrylate peracid hydrolase
MATFPVNPGRTALVNVDLQNVFVENAPDGRVILERVNRLAAECRRAGILVIHTSHVLRADGSNIGVLGDLVPAVKDEGFLAEGSWGAALHAALRLEPGDVLLPQPRFGAFHGTDLEMILRQRSIDTIAISGISTDVCCDTTAREANARDFRVLFLIDATATNADTPEEAAAGQQATLNIIGMFAEPITTAELERRMAEAVGSGGPAQGASR